MIKRITLLLLLVASYGLHAQSPEKYKRVKINLNGQSILTLSRLGLDVDHGDYRKGVSFTSDFSEQEIKKIEKAGFTVDVQMEDVKKYYREQSQSSQATQKTQAINCASAVPVYPVPTNFALGNYAGYFSYQEMLDNLDSMAAKYPNLITIKQLVSTTLTTDEGRPMYYVKLSDNPNVNETEPQILYTALHHAREPGGMSSVIYYLWYLMENYSTSSEIQSLVDNTEMYFIPCVNPDGYLYNELTDPFGGGLWRKNRHDNQDGTYGIDLNRNYGYNWGFDDNGSSPFSSDETYRGTAPFSEAETQMVRDFSIAHNFKIAINFHTFGNLLIYPWGYIPSYYTPDSALLTNYGQLLTRYNDYSYGTADQTVGYVTNGSSDDWLYGEQGLKPKVLSLTPETGDAAFGFWPPSTEIIPLCQSNMYMCLTAAKLLGRYTRVDDLSSDVISTTTGYIQFSLTQLGLDTSGSYTVSLTPVSANVTATGAPKVLNSFNVNSTQYDSISFSLSLPLLYGTKVKFLLSVDNGQYIITDTLEKTIGNYSTVYSTNANTMTGWQSTSGWGTGTSVFFSSPASITDSPIGFYNSNAFTSVQTTSPINLVNAIKAKLEFYTRYELEARYDYAEARVSVDNGLSWTPVCGKFTRTGGLAQDPGNPLYSGFQSSWVREQISLDDFLGQNILLQFILVSDGFTEYDGFYFDDLIVKKVIAGGVDMEEPTDYSDLSVYPNPAKDNIEVKYPGIENAQLVINDITGRKVREINLSPIGSTATVNIKDLSKGLYIYSINTTAGKIKTGKLVVE